jgi:4-deoxy-L-threo-5-hexosulose-uronate ketol-isomerase
MGILNIGKTGQVTVGDATYTLGNGELLNIGIGAGPVAFSGGRFYLTSCPAHRNCPTKMIKLSDARRVEPGTRETANQRVIIQFPHPEVCETCQLPMGYTQFQPGSLWSTMPAHLHDRRMEAYLYFDLPDDARVFHFMGTPEETHHIVMANEQAVIAPPWSIHCGAGTAAYTFCWGMAGDNMDFGDMDMVAMDDLR